MTGAPRAPEAGRCEMGGGITLVGRQVSAGARASPCWSGRRRPTRDHYARPPTTTFAMRGMTLPTVLSPLAEWETIVSESRCSKELVGMHRHRV